MWDMWWLIIPAVVAVWFAWRFRFVRVLIAIVAVGAILLFPLLVRVLNSVAETRESSATTSWTTGSRLTAACG